MSENTTRTTTTRRGFVYSYHYTAPKDGKPTILFLHGFPSTHQDWAAQTTYFSDKGYGVIAPDLLGYGDTDAPEDANKYWLVDMAGDIVDILDDLGVDKVIGVGHDWGSALLSRLINIQADRILGVVFVAVGYWEPQPQFSIDAWIETFNKLVGYDVWGYWKFFEADDAPAIDSFYSLAFPNDPAVWRSDLAPLNKAREWVEQNKQLPTAPFWTAEKREAHKKALLKKGLRGPCNWYRGFMSEGNKAAEASIKKEAYSINIPTFFAAALKDYVCVAELHKEGTRSFCSNVAIKDFDTGHWIMLETPNELNEALGNFIATLQK